MPLPMMDTGTSVLTTLGYLCLLLGVIFTAYYLLRRFNIHGMGAATKGGPRMQSRLMLGNQQSVTVVRYRGKDLVLGVTADRIQLLREFDAVDDGEELAEPTHFANVLRRSTDDEG